MKIVLGLVLMVLGTNSFAKDINVKVSGMVCSLCGQGIKKKFLQRKEVKSIEVNMDDKVVLIKIDDTQDISDDEIKKIITEAGYNVTNIERK